jgi:hypothetical protein
MKCVFDSFGNLEEISKNSIERFLKEFFEESSVL